MCSRNQSAVEKAAKKLIAETGVDVLPLVADVSRADDIDRLAAETLEHFGRIDALFINAGGPKPGHFVDLQPQDWDDSIELTIQSAIRLAYAVVPVMQTQGGGSILANTSVTVRHPLDGLTISNALRAAVIGLVKTLSIELGPNNIRVNAISPGLVETEASKDQLSPEQFEMFASAVPLGRAGKPEDILGLALFLASDLASFITGTIIPVGGGPQ